MGRGIKEAGKKAIRVHVPIESGRKGLLRYQQRSSIAKPEGLFQYDVLALLIVDEGSCAYLIDEKKVAFQKNTMFWAFPDQQRTMYERSADYSVWVIEFTSEFLKEVCTERQDVVLKETHPGRMFCRRMPGSELQFIRQILCRLLKLGSAGNNDYFNAGLHYVLQHCWQVFTSTSDLADQMDVHPAVAKVVHFIRDEGDVESSVADLSARAGLCTSRLIPLFQEQMGITITEFRNRQKLDRFFESYNYNGNLNMLGAALDAGFGSYAQFYRIFKETMKQSPREYFKQDMPSLGKPEIPTL